MTDEGLAPRVENAQAADLGSQVTRVGGDLAQRGRARLEEPVVDTTGIAVAERQQRVREFLDNLRQIAKITDRRKQIEAATRRTSGQ